jgi:hypothetical protein
MRYADGGGLTARDLLDGFLGQTRLSPEVERLGSVLITSVLVGV